MRHKLRESEGGSLTIAEQSATIETSPTARRWLFWSGLFVVWMFAAGFLQFGLIDHLAPPAAKRVNDGERATFFAVHINPYYVFSEDFHLYVVRSKRILDRGWTDALLCRTSDAKPNYSSPLQAMLMMLAVQTDGRPIPYSLFVAGVFAIAWGILYVASTRWLPDNISPFTPVIAVLVTVLFESFEGLTHWTTDFGQWPVHRGLRMATLAWTSPLALSVLLASVALVMRPARPWLRLAFIAVVLAALAAADNWAFLLATGCSAISAVALAVSALTCRKKSASGFRSRLVCVVGIGIAALLALAVHQLTSSGFTGDVLTRAGFGPQWRSSPLGASVGRSVPRHLRSLWLLLVAMFLLSSIYVRFSPTRSWTTVRSRLSIAWPAPERLYFLLLAGIPLMSTILTVSALSLFGMDEYHAFQFFWRSDFMFLFALIVVVSECLKHVVRAVVSRRVKMARVELALASLFLIVFFIYHNVRIYEFVSRTASREFFLTKDEEMLRDWLTRQEASRGTYTLATASHELNYLCAYWTNADLLLPEGFPFHSSSTIDEIEKQCAALLAVYRTTPERWREFNLHRHVWDQWSWARSRLVSARHGYMYYLLHRALLVGGREPEVLRKMPRKTTSFVAEQMLYDDATLRAAVHRRFKEGLESMERIARHLQAMSRSAKASRPEVIVIDDVSRALGTPALEGYTKEFEHGTLEAWVKSR